jgi:uncharacterized protein
MERMFKNILKFRWLILFLVFALTVFLAIQIPRIRINSDVVSSLPDNDPDAVLFKKIGSKFGGNKTGMVILETDNVYRTDVLEHVKQITDTLKEIEGISSVTSLTNIMHVNEGADGMEIGQLVDENNLPDTPEELSLLRQRVLSGENYKGTIVSEDGTTAIIVFSIADDADIQLLANTVKGKSGALGLPEKIYYAGSPMMITSIAHLISADLTRLLPVAFLLITLVLFLGFRSLRGVIIPLLTATLSIIWVIGIMALTGSEMSMVTNNIPIVLLAVGTAYAIHVLNRIDQEKEDLNRSVIIAMAYVFIPVLLAALTTMAGFISFIFGSYLKMIRDFGIYTALGTFFALLLSLFFVPALISAFKWKNRDKTLEKWEAGKSFFTDHFKTPLQNLVFGHTKGILATWVVLTIIGIGGIFLIKRNVDVRNYFRKGDPTRIAEDIMTRSFGGSKPVFVHFKGDVQSPEFLEKMLKTEEYMKHEKCIVSTQSVADLIVEINAAFGEGRKIPADKAMIEQLWFMLDGNENVQKFVSEDLDEAIIIAKYMSAGSNTKKEFENYMNGFIKENSTPECSIQITGMPFIEANMDRSLINSQIASILIAVLVVIIIVSAILRSFKAGIFAATPIISTILILFGIMGFTGIPLNIATALVASIAMGIGIDYSIHVITHFNHSLKDGATVAVAMEETIGISGKAIVINVISVSIGFIVLLFSEMVPLQYFGLLIFLSMVGSGFSALTFLPAILILSHRKDSIVPGLSKTRGHI